MKNSNLVAPSLLSANFGNLAAEIKDVSKLGADWFHVDIMDGSFVPPITFGDNMVQTAKANSSLPLDVHLMIVKPDNHFQSFKDAGADRITIHIETVDDPKASLNKIKSLGMKCGLTLKPATPVASIEPYIELCDLILVMSVNPGWSGQKFIPESLAKIERVRSLIEQRHLKTLIQVDGGINDITGAECVRAGAEVLVAGSFVFGAKDRRQAIDSLKYCGR